MSAITLTREQLYERVWSQPMVKVAAEFGLSDVAVKKMCRRMNVPTPERGYWAKLAAGQKMRKPMLPKQHEIAATQLDPVLNTERREQEQNERDQMKPLEVPLDLELSKLHPHARTAHAVLSKGKPDHHGMVSDEREPLLPLVHVSVANIGRLCRALHVIYSELESRGVVLDAVSIYDRKRLGFKLREDNAGLIIEEPITSTKRTPTPEELKRPSREWRLESMQPSGHFKMIVLGLHGHSVDRVMNRNEGPRRSLNALVTEVTEGIWGHFVRQEEFRERRRKEAEAEVERQKAEAERRRIAAEQKAVAEARRKEEERQEAHRKKLAALAVAKVENALRAAEWWRLHRQLLDYAAECEREWSGAAALTEEQRQWLSWVRAEAKAMSPFAFGYPNFSQDGAFDGTSIAVGGPYPASSMLPLPPTMQNPEDDEADAPVANDTAAKGKTSEPPAPTYPPSAAPARPQFPFWLLHRGRR
jgi:hypothetical protein